MVDESNVRGRSVSFCPREAEAQASEAGRTRPFYTISGGANIRFERPFQGRADPRWTENPPRELPLSVGSCSPSCPLRKALCSRCSAVSDSSAVESLLQLSSQLNGLLNDSANPDRSLTNGTNGKPIGPNRAIRRNTNWSMKVHLNLSQSG